MQPKDSNVSLFPEIDPHSGLKIEIRPYTSPTGGWGSVSSLVQHTRHEAAAGALGELVRQNKPDGFACTSCAWAKPAKAHLAEFCENGAKATFAELTSRRIGAEFFAKHTVGELLSWPDHDIRPGRRSRGSSRPALRPPAGGNSRAAARWRRRARGAGQWRYQARRWRR